MAIVDELVAILGYDLTDQDDYRRFQAQLDSIEDRVSSVADATGKVMGIATAAVAAGVGFLGFTIIQTNAKMEGFLTSLETIEGSAAKAEQAMDWITEFGASTPFEIDRVTDAFVRLRAFGIDPIANDTLRILGDTSSAMNKQLIDAVEMFTDASTGEFERLKEFGIRARQQGNQVTFEWTRDGEVMRETVKKDAAAIREFLLETLGSRFENAMERQSKKFGGMVSNLGDYWIKFQTLIGDAGFFGIVTAQVSRVLTAIQELENDGQLEVWAQRISSMLSATFGAGVFLAERFINNIGFLSENMDSLLPYITAVSAALFVLTARAFPVITAFVLIGLAVDDLISYLQGGESMIGSFVEKFQEITGLTGPVGEAIGEVSAAVIAGLAGAFLIAPGSMVKLFGKILLSGLAVLGPLIFKGVVAAFALLSNPVGWVILIGGAAAGLIYLFWDELVAAKDWLAEKIPGWLADVGSWFLDEGWWRLTGVGMMISLWEGLKSVGPQIQEWFWSILPDWAKDFFGGQETTDPRFSGRSKDGETIVAQKGSGRPGQAYNSGAIGIRQRRALDRLSAEESVGAVARGGNTEINQSNNITLNQNFAPGASPDEIARQTGREVERSLTPPRRVNTGAF